MAQVAGSVSRHAELLLAHCTDTWRRLPEVEAEIEGWDLLDRIDFVEEWPLEEQRLKMLEQYASEGMLTPYQLVRYGELKHLPAQNRPIIRRLQQS